MSTNHTPNYGLCQWKATDKVLHSDFNEDNQKIDAALGELAGNLGRKGNCVISRGYRRGNGKYGQANPCQYNTTKIPTLIFIADQSTGKFLTYIEGSETSLSPWFPNSAVKFSSKVGVKEDLTVYHTISWYSDTPEHQFNIEGGSYAVITIYQAQ